MAKDDRLIIGSGISGLIWKFYHPTYEIIAPVQDQPINGDQFTRSNMVWLHACRETLKLLSDLGWENTDKLVEKCVIGYYYKKWISDGLSPDVNLTLIQKKMTAWNEHPKRNFVPTSSQLSMTSDVGVNFMKVLRVDLNEMITRLKSHCSVTHGYVTYVSETLVGITNTPGGEGAVYNGFSKLISTIPAPFFWKAWESAALVPDHSREFKHCPITNVIVKEKPAMFDDKYEMIYYDFTVPYSRISKHEKGYTLEFTGEIPAVEFEKQFPQHRIVDHFIVPMGRIWTKPNDSPCSSIIFSGRFAQWNHVITTEYVAHQAMSFRG